LEPKTDNPNADRIVVNYVEVDQRNDRVAISNAVVRILNETQEGITGTQSFFEQFLTLDQLTESQQRGTWALLDLMEFDDQEEIDAAKTELITVFNEASEEDKILLEPALVLIDSYASYGPVYKEVADVIKSKKLSPTELEVLFATRFGELALANEGALSNFEAIQYEYIQGN